MLSSNCLLPVMHLAAAAAAAAAARKPAQHGSGTCHAGSTSVLLARQQNTAALYGAFKLAAAMFRSEGRCIVTLAAMLHGTHCVLLTAAATVTSEPANSNRQQACPQLLTWCVENAFTSSWDDFLNPSHPRAPQRVAGSIEKLLCATAITTVLMESAKQDSLSGLRQSDTRKVTAGRTGAAVTPDCTAAVPGTSYCMLLWAGCFCGHVATWQL
jgi:hypothetical protein